MAELHLLAVTRLSPMWLPQLASVCEVHDRLHLTDKAAFARISPQIRAIAAAGDSKVDAELIDALPALEFISVMGVGYDGIDVAAALARGVLITHTPNVLNDDVADLAIALMLATARQLPAADRYVRSGSWTEGPMPLGRKMSRARLGLIGMGRIGQAIAHRAAAFGMSVAYTARSRNTALPQRYFATPAELAAESDFLVVAAPGGTQTRKLVDAAVLDALGPRGVLINVSRGSVVDEAALVSALERGTIAGAGLDVFESEPQVPAALLHMPHVVLTPHIGSATTQTRRAMADLAHANLQAWIAGRPPMTPIPECAEAGSTAVRGRRSAAQPSPQP